jgi:lipoyl(octanoyl) transferase
VTSNPGLAGYWLDLGLVPYVPAFQQQEMVLESRMSGRLPSTVILQENPPTFTIGRAGSRANVLASPELLSEKGVEVLEVNRGGDVTYHGPGQIVASPLLYLGDVDLNANQYLHRLEDVVMELLATFGVQTRKIAEYPGVWWGEQKIGAVGIAVRHGYTFHGLSLNVNLDLSPYNWINPCGVERLPVTSLQLILGRQVALAEVKSRLRAILQHTFSLSLSTISWEELQGRLQSAP